MSIEAPDFATVCILSYERAEFLDTALTTAVQGAEYPVEVIVHDDGSKDPAVHRVLGAALSDGRVSSVIVNPPGHNQGQGVALNRMFRMAKGDPIVKMDQDLVLEAGWLRRSVDLIRDNFERVYQRDFVQEPLIGALGLFKYSTDPVDYRKMFVRDHGEPGSEWEEHEDFVGSAMVIPREVWDAYGPFEEYSAAFAEDRDFKFRVRDEGGLALALPKDRDLAINQGFGVGPSTVVVDHGKVAAIHGEPPVIRPSN